MKLLIIIFIFLCFNVYADSASLWEQDGVKAYRKDGKTIIIYTNKQYVYVKKSHKKGEHTTITKTTKIIIGKKKKVITTNTEKESYKHGEKKKKTNNKDDKL